MNHMEQIAKMFGKKLKERLYPKDWRLNKISDIRAVKLLKEMRYNALNATQYDDEKREAKAEALKMAIEALGGKDDGRE